MAIVTYYCPMCDTLNQDCDVSPSGERQCLRCSDWVIALTRRDVLEQTINDVPPWAYEQAEMKLR